ncbi:MAG: phosphotransferase, partial [Spirochaetota bacterium]
CRNINISVLSGGITNKLYRVCSEKGDLAVRIYGDKTELFINRDYESESMKMASTIGIAPRLIKYLPEYNVTIVEYITHGYTLKNPDFLQKELREKIVNPIRRLHHSDIKLPKVFNPLNEIISMANILESLKVNYPEFDIKGTIEKLKKLYMKINFPESSFTPCHNDLLAENFILVKEGYQHLYTEPLYIIDWEYAGMAPPYYDMADMFQEILVDRETEKSFVEYYCEGNNYEQNLYFIDMFKPFPDIYWFLWSLNQQNISTIKFDFYNYGKVKYYNAQKNLRFLNDEYGIAI